MKTASIITHRVRRAILSTSAATLLASMNLPQHDAAGQAFAINGPQVYSQNFDSLPTAAGNWANDATLPAWYAFTASTFPNTGVLATIPLALYTTGGARASGFFSAGTGTERSLAWGATTTNYGASAMGVVFQNTGGSPLSIGNISFNGELYVGQANANAADGLQFFYQIGSTAITNLAGTAVHDNGANYATNAALDDTGWTRITGLEYFDSVATASQIQNPAKQKLVSANAGLTLLPGEFITFRWRSFNETGTDGIVGIDDLSILFNTFAGRNLIYNLAHAVGGGNPNGNGVWQMNGNAYWLEGATPTGFNLGDNATFSQNPATTASITVGPADVIASTVTVSHTSGTYSFIGAGRVTGNLVKENAGTLVLTSANNYGSVTLNGGNTITQNADAFGPAASITVNTPAQLTTDADLTMTGGLHGPALLTKQGPGALTVAGTGTGTGGVKVQDGTLRALTGAAFGPQNIELDGTTLAFAHATGDQTLNAGTTIAIGAGGGTINVENAPAGPAGVGAIINTADRLTGSGTIVKTGPGVLRMRQDQTTFSGNWLINDGVVEYGNGFASALGSGVVTVNPGGTLAGQNTPVPVASIVLAGGALGTRTGALTDFQGAVDVVADSELRLRSFSTPTGAQQFTISGIVSGTGTLNLTGNTPLTNSGGTAAAILTNVGNTYAGTFHATLFQTLTSEPAGGTGSTLNGRPVELSGGRLRVRDNGIADGGTLAYGNPITVDTADSAIDVDRQAAGTFSNNTVVLAGLTIGAQTLAVTGGNGYGVSFTSANLNGGAGTTTTISPAFAVNATIEGAVTGAAGLTKGELGTLTLNGPASHTGDTNVDAGLLVLSAAGSIPASPRIEVKAGAILDVNATVFTVGAGQTLAGAGNVIGTVAVANTGRLEPGDAALDGTLTVDGLVFGAAATVRVGTAAPAGAINVLGTNGFMVNGGANTVTINVAGNAPAVGQYTLIDYDGTIGGAGGVSSFVIGTTQNRVVANLVNNGPNTSIDLNVTSVNIPVWTGAVSSEWSTNILANPKNWKEDVSTLNTDYLQGDRVLFNDSAATTTVDISAATVFPTVLRFENNTKNYVLQGTAGIGGTVALEKSGAARLTINNTNSFTGAANLNGGTVTVGAVADSGTPSPLGAGSLIRFDGSRLEFTGASGSTNRAIEVDLNGGIIANGTGSSLALAGAISGSGGLTKEGAGILTLAEATNSFTGGVAINGGAISVAAVADAGANSPLGAGFQIAMDGGTLEFTGVTGTTNRDVSLGDDGGSVQTTGTLMLAGIISGTGGLNQRGVGGTLRIGGAVDNTYSGVTRIVEGTLVAQKPAGIVAIPGDLIIEAGATFRYTGNDVSNQIADTSSITITGGTFGEPTDATPVNPGATDTVANLTVNGGAFGSGRNATIAPFTITGLLQVAGGTVLAQRGGGIAASQVQILGGSVDLDGGSTTANQQSRLNVGSAGLVLTGSTINFNAGPSTVAAGSVGSVLQLDGNVTSTGNSTFVRLNPTVSSAVVDLNGGVRVFDVTGSLAVGAAGATIAVNNGGLTKIGPGTLNLTGTGNYAVGTIINNGVLNALADGALGDPAGPVAINNGATLQAGGAITSSRAITLGAGGGRIDTNGQDIILTAASSVSGTTLTKVGAGTLDLAGTQSYAALIAEGGTTIADSAIGTGATSVVADSSPALDADDPVTVVFKVSQTLANLQIGSNASVILSASFPSPSPQFEEASATLPENFGVGDAFAADSVQPVPEPSAVSLLALGLWALTARRRRRSAETIKPSRT